MDAYTYNQKEAAEIPRTNCEERGFGEYDMHRACWRQEGKWKAVSNLSNKGKAVSSLNNKLVRPRTGRDGEKADVTKC